MLLITVEDFTIFSDSPEDKPEPSTNHFLTPLTVTEFVIAYSAEIAGHCERFRDIDMRGWFNIQNVCDIGDPSVEQIENMIRVRQFPVRIFPETKD